jgi:AraC-like DNA-binding protein
VTTTWVYREHLPAAPLRAHVACYWTLDGAGTEPRRILPDGCMDLLFDVSGAAAPTVVGTMTKPLISSFPHASRIGLLGVRFLPGEAFAFLDGVPAWLLRDALVPLEELWKTQARDLGQQLALLPDTASRVRRLDGALAVRRCARLTDLRVRRAVGAIRDAGGGVRVAGLAKSVGLGERQLQRLFDDQVGVGPKAFARVTRVQGLVRRLGPRTAWSALAADLGWSDQAHLTRDVRDIAGITPSELARALRMSDSFNPPHGPLPMLPP